MADIKREGVKRTEQGAVYLYFSSSNPTGTQQINGLAIAPFAKAVTSSGAIIVRYA